MQVLKSKRIKGKKKRRQCSMVYILLGEGFEEVEAVAPVDILRRADIEALTVSLTGDLLVRGGHGIAVQADITINEVVFDDIEMLVLPGGGGGVESIASSPAAMDLILRVWNAEKKLAALCAAPSLLARLDILNGLAVVCYPVVYEEIKAAGGNLQPELPVVTVGNLTTGKAAGTAIDFGLELVAVLRGREAADKMRNAIFYK